MKEHYPGRIVRSAPAERLGHAPNAALLIDFDNVTMGIRSDLQHQLRRLLNSEIIKGKVAVQRAYADWRRYPQYIVPLSEASIDLIFAPAFGSNKKNATDIRLAIDALELVFTRPEIGTFILLSGDSDFSSLVLKLKEYGKYIIGVGIRESASDLLIQNCDEYYSYAEVTGLTKEGEIEPTRRDPWELVVEAVLQMKQEGDVMRSDRLKQVMQTLDPNFTEKDAGFSRFSRFVVEAGQRGLLQIEKLENGQYAIEVGTNANVPPEEQPPARRPDANAEVLATKPRRRRPPRRPEDSEPQRRLTLAESFELLRQALLVLGAVGEQSAASDEVRGKMAELLGDERDPLFERPRFQRLLRQAHDANLIELAKGVDEVYQVRLGAQGVEPVVEAAPEPSGKAETPPSEPAAAEKRPRSRRASTRKGSRSKRQEVEGKAPAAEAPTGGRAAPISEASASAAARASVASSPAAPRQDASSPGGQPAKRRNPRFRRGSRGSSAKRAPSSAAAGQGDANPAPAPSPTPQPGSHGAPRVGRRTGSRGGRRPHEKTGGSAPGSTEAMAQAGRPVAGEPAAQAPPPHGDANTGRSEPTPPPAEDRAPPQEETSLFKRMSAALQRVVRGPDN